jgi:hypothetical protein
MSDYRPVLERARRQFPAPEMQLDAIVRRQRRQVRRRVGTAVLALAISGAAIGGRLRVATPPAPRPADDPTSRPSGTAFERARGWIAYNDGTGIWAVNPRKAYAGAFSPSDHPDDTVRLAGAAAGDPIAWSADGSRLLVRRPGTVATLEQHGGVMPHPQRQSLFVLDADGSETQVTDMIEYIGHASISPDGTQVVYARGVGPGGDHPYRLEVATVGDGPPAVLLTSEELHLGAPAFSPDGRRIAYVEGGGDHSNGLWVMDADGTNRRKIAGGDWAHVVGLVWSSDGERLAFSCPCPGGEGVYTIRADGTSMTLLAAEPSLPMPQWSPDGSQIAFVPGEFDFQVTEPPEGSLVVVGAQGGEGRRILARGRGLVTPTIAWNPAG